MYKELQELRALVKSIKGPAGIQTPTHINNTSNVFNQQNITFIVQPQLQRNNFGAETIHHITNEFVREALLNLRKGAVDMVHKVHYDPTVPENNNIAYKSAKSKQMSAVIEGTWLSKPISSTVEEIIRKVLQLMNSRFPEYADDPDMINNKDGIFKWMRDVMSMNNDKYYSLRKDIIALIQNQTELYNPMLEDKLKMECLQTLNPS
jgi:hypothetical protein